MMSNSLTEQLKQHLCQIFEHVEYRAQATTDWLTVTDNNEQCIAEYLPAKIDYHLSYLSSALDLSVVIYQNNQPIAVWPLAITKQKESYTLLSNCTPVRPPLFANDISAKVKKKILQQCLQFLQFFQQTTKGSITVHFQPEQDVTWQRLIHPHLTNVCYHQQLMLNVLQPLSDIKRNMRKSYKSLINKGMKIWDVNVHRHISDKFIEEIRQFHIETAGKETRTIASWQAQQQVVNSENAFVVTLRDAQQKMVGLGYFSITSHEACYGMGIYDRSLFDKPLGHVVQMRAIEYMQELGLSRYYLGKRNHMFETPTPTEKESSIGFFKEGFSDHIVVTIDALFN